MSKHTPGPWRFDTFGELTSNSHGILWVNNDEHIVYNNHHDRPLIEAAPDLLEALKDLRSCIDETRGSDAHKALLKADEAIKKAEGGE